MADFCKSPVDVSQVITPTMKQTAYYDTTDSRQLELSISKMYTNQESALNDYGQFEAEAKAIAKGLGLEFTIYHNFEPFLIPKYSRYYRKKFEAPTLKPPMCESRFIFPIIFEQNTDAL